MIPEPIELWVRAPYIAPKKKRKTGKITTRKPWLNSNDRDHWRTTKPITAQWRAEAHNAAIAAGLPRGLDHVTITAEIVRTRRGRMDPGNYYPTLKPIIDGLTDYGLTPDDDYTHLDGPFIYANEEPGPPGVILYITPTPPKEATP